MVSVSKKLKSRSVKIQAPVLIVDSDQQGITPVWMDRDFFPNLLDQIKEYDLEVKHIRYHENMVTLKFKDEKHATKFRIIYEQQTKKKVF